MEPRAARLRLNLRLPDGSHMIARMDQKSVLVKIQLDCGWTDLGGQSPLALFKKYSGCGRMRQTVGFYRFVARIIRGHKVKNRSQRGNSAEKR